MLVSVAALFAATTFSRAAAPEVLSDVPDNAPVVIVLKNLKDLNTKLANASTRMNLGGPQDPLNTMLAGMGLSKGVDMAGDAAVVLLPKAKAENDEAPADPTPPFVLLIPTSDANALLEPFKPGEAVKGISEVMLPQNPDQKGYAAKLAKHVAFAENKETLESFLVKKGPLNKALTPESVKAFENNDLVVYANIAVVGPEVVKSIDAQRNDFSMMLDLMLLSGASPKEGALAKEMIGMAFDGLKQFMTDANTGIVTVRMSDAGFTLGAAGHFKAESDLGKFVAAQKPKAPLTLTGLPAGNMLAAGAFAFDGKTVSERMQAASEKVFKNPALANDADAKKAFDDAVKAMTHFESFSFVMMPGADNSFGNMTAVTLAPTKDAKKVMAINRDLYKQKGMKDLASMNPDIKADIQFKENATTVKGVALDRVQVKYVLREETAESPISNESKQAFEIIQNMYGADGQISYFGIVGGNIIGIATKDVKAIETAIDAANNKKEELAKSRELNAVQAQVLPDPSGVLYLPVENWLKMAGMGGPEEGKPAIPTVISMNVTGSNMHVEMFVPMSTAAQLVQVAQQFAPLFGGGGFGPPPQP